MNIIDLFSGGGGLTEGFTRKEYKIVAHIEKDKWACETLKTRIIFNYLKEKNDLELYNKYLEISINYKKVDLNRKIIFEKYPELEKRLEYEVLNCEFGNKAKQSNATDIKDIIKRIYKSMKYNNVEKIDLIIGGPPCQAYSLVGRSVMKGKVDDDDRNYLFRYYKQIVGIFSPKMFIFENVPGIITAKNGKILDCIKNEFEEIGYTLLSGKNKNIKDNIIECSTLNIPQRRKRLILFGFKKEDKLEYPDFLKYKFDINNITTKDIIGDLPKRKSGVGEYGEILKYSSNTKLTEYQKAMRKNSKFITQHQTRYHNDKDIQNYYDAIKKTSKGERFKYTDIPKFRRTHKNIKSFMDRYKVHWWDDVPHTILAHISKDGNYNIHPDITQCRTLTVREAARIQTFPDNYFFEGPRTAQYQQIGNAVPPFLAIIIAQALLDIYNKKDD